MLSHFENKKKKVNKIFHVLQELCKLDIGNEILPSFSYIITLKNRN